MVLQYVFPAFQLGFYWWFPESPYWLINHDKGRERAEASFRGIYGHKVDPAFIEMEYDRISANVAFTRSLEAATSVGGPLLYQCFRGTNRIRTLTSIFAAASQILIGASFVLGYLTYFLQLINVQNVFTVSAILFVVMLLSTSSAFPMVEMVGRRRLIVPGCFILTFFLFIIGIMGCISNKTAAGWVRARLASSLGAQQYADQCRSLSYARSSGGSRISALSAPAVMWLRRNSAVCLFGPARNLSSP
jgi:hypothetical protein